MNHPKSERTFVIIKPDGVQRSLIGEIINRYERIGLKLAGIKIVVPDEKIVEKHYTLDPAWMKRVGENAIKGYVSKGQKPPSEDAIEIGKQVLLRLKKYITSGPVVAMVWKGAHAVKIVRKLTGGTEPLTSDVGTVRGDFVLDSYQMADRDERAIRNVIHASGSVEEAENEINLWFKKDEIVEYRHIQEQIIYDVNIDGILE
ncbi:nucleoside-diphosphate kinase [Candidatus Nomurabacteria bacterium]|nr:nucleoside-diphosphate kinase [Candidatus Nomurabacteria bacterium]